MRKKIKEELEKKTEQEKMTTRELSRTTLDIIFNNFLNAQAVGGEYLKDTLEEAKVMVQVVKAEQQELALAYKKRELDQKDREFEYKTTVVDPFEQKKAMAEVGFKSRFLDLVEQGKAVGNFGNFDSLKLSNFISNPKAIPTTEVVADVKLSED